MAQLLLNAEDDLLHRVASFRGSQEQLQTTFGMVAPILDLGELGFGTLISRARIDPMRTTFDLIAIAAGFLACGVPLGDSGKGLGRTRIQVGVLNAIHTNNGCGLRRMRMLLSHIGQDGVTLGAEFIRSLPQLLCKLGDVGHGLCPVTAQAT